MRAGLITVTWTMTICSDGGGLRGAAEASESASEKEHENAVRYGSCGKDYSRRRRVPKWSRELYPEPPRSLHDC